MVLPYIFQSVYSAKGFFFGYEVSTKGLRPPDDN